MDLQITLAAAGLAALINIWLAARCGKARVAAQVSHGDGGDEHLIKCMRSHANFGEYTPMALILIAALELSGQAGWALSGAAFAFLLGRISHGIGMVLEDITWPRVLGMLLTLPILLGLAVAAFLAAFGVI